MTMTRTYAIPHWLRLGVPRSCQGQATEYAYAIDLQLGVAVRRARCGRSETWSIATLTDDEQAVLEHYESGGADYPPAVEADYQEVVATTEE